MVPVALLRNTGKENIFIFLSEGQKLRFRFVSGVYQVGCFKIREKWEVGVEANLILIDVDTRQNWWGALWPLVASHEYTWTYTHATLIYHLEKQTFVTAVGFREPVAIWGFSFNVELFDRKDCRVVVCWTSSWTLQAVVSKKNPQRWGFETTLQEITRYFFSGQWRLVVLRMAAVITSIVGRGLVIRNHDAVFRAISRQY